MERSGPVHRLGAKLCEIQAGLRSVQKRLEQRSPNMIEVKITQKVCSDGSVGREDMFSLRWRLAL